MSPRIHSLRCSVSFAFGNISTTSSSYSIRNSFWYVSRSKSKNNQQLAWTRRLVKGDEGSGVCKSWSEKGWCNGADLVDWDSSWGVWTELAQRAHLNWPRFHFTISGRFDNYGCQNKLPCENQAVTFTNNSLSTARWWSVITNNIEITTPYGNPHSMEWIKNKGRNKKRNWWMWPNVGNNWTTERAGFDMQGILPQILWLLRFFHVHPVWLR